jgi:hypothetical protein
MLLKRGLRIISKMPYIDLSGHLPPPCQDLLRNQGYYALSALAHNIGRIIDLVGRNKKRCESKRKKKIILGLGYQHYDGKSLHCQL